MIVTHHCFLDCNSHKNRDEGRQKNGFTYAKSCIFRVSILMKSSSADGCSDGDGRDVKKCE